MREEGLSSFVPFTLAGSPWLWKGMIATYSLSLALLFLASVGFRFTEGEMTKASVAAYYCSVCFGMGEPPSEQM